MPAVTVSVVAESFRCIVNHEFPEAAQHLLYVIVPEAFKVILKNHNY